ncbi:hypothetical protein [Planctellipticum variicoloris]|uniref:hypothetical protein n=1 Tax=Planctellipticum variicoloris TaxID=3064265 RepID=UPI003013E6CD|nr:PilZ domain-containing protein [Planctomycetaceae bacterium SH412]
MKFEKKVVIVAILSIEDYSVAHQRAAERVLEKLQRLDARIATKYGRERRHLRQAVRCVLEIHMLPKLRTSDGSPFRAYSVDVSQSGVGFIAPAEIYDDQVCVGVPGKEGRHNWFLAEIVRKRQVPEEMFWEYGAVLLARVDNPVPIQAEPAT